MSQPAANPADEMAELARIWLDQVKEDCGKAERLAESADNADADRGEISHELYRVFHDMQGQAGLFGYPLLAKIGTRFCRYWRGKNDFTEADRVLVQAHLKASRFVLERGIKSDDEAAGEAILNKLDDIIAAQK